MKYINLKTMEQEASIPSSSILCLGNFDGVHIGHRQLVASVLDTYSIVKMNNASLISGAWFFDSSSYKSADEIYTLEEKLNIFSKLGLDYAIVADFEEMKSLSPEEFVNEVLIKDCRCIHAVCGENFRFGTRASGDSNTLIRFMNGNATVVPLLSTADGLNDNKDIVVSSTYIRSLLSAGNIKKANELLGENYSIFERVLHGKALGRTIGIPTINQTPGRKNVILKNGIYATKCTVDNVTYMGVTNVGIRPTVDENGAKNIETYIIDFDGDCYDKYVKTEFISRIRDEKKFESIEALKSQIQNDIKSTIELLNKQ